MKLRRLGMLLLLCFPLLAGAGPPPAPSPTTILTHVYTAHRLFAFKRWANEFAGHNDGAPPVSVQQLLRQLPAKDGAGWLWLVDRGQTADYQLNFDFVTGGWAVAGKPTRPDSGLSLYLSSEPQAVILGGDAGGMLGNTALPPLDVRALETSLDAYLEGPGDLEALLKGLAVFDAQTVLQLKTGACACTLDELAAARAADHRLIDQDLPRSDGYFDYSLDGVKEADGRCRAWVFRAKNRLEAFPAYEVGSDRAVWVLPSWGAKKGLRFPFDQWRAVRR